MEGFIDINLAVTVFVIALIVASMGALVGFLTKKVLTLLGIFVVFGLILQFHTYLPFPPEVDAQLMAIKARIWPW